MWFKCMCNIIINNNNNAYITELESESLAVERGASKLEA